jgi:transposase-like protein
MTKQRQFTDAFKAEAVGLVRTSGQRADCKRVLRLSITHKSDLRQF